MIITRMEAVDRYKVKIYIDEAYAFTLTEKEAEQYSIQEGINLSSSEYDKILQDTIYHRALSKALSILKFTDRSEAELRNKLLIADYPSIVIDQVIQYVKNYGYLDDIRFASTFIRARMNRKSRLMLQTELLQKGIAKDIIREALAAEYRDEEGEEDAEATAIRKAIAKKTSDPSSLSPEEKQKLIASLYRKGFDIGKIKQFL